MRVEPLARQLAVTKGSFYWHFRDRQHLLDRMLEEWRRSTLTAVIESIWGKPSTPQRKLESLWRMCFSGRIDNPGGKLEAALRQWSLGDNKVADLLALVDEERIAFLAKIYGEMGVANPDSKARLFYSYVVGRNTISQRLELPNPRDDAEGRALLIDS